MICEKTIVVIPIASSTKRQCDYDHNPCEFYVVINMLAFEYGKTRAKCSAD